MNNIYKVIWSKAKNCYVVASEIAKSHTKSASGSEKMGGYGKKALLALAAASAFFCGGLVNVGATVHVNEGTGVTSEVYTTGETYNKTEVDNALTAKGAATDVATNKADIANLKTAVGDASSGLVKDVADLKNQGNDLNTAIGNKADQSGLDAANAKITVNEGKITDLQAKTANLSADGKELTGMTTVSGAKVSGDNVEAGALKVTGEISNGAGVTTTLADIKKSMDRTDTNKTWIGKLNERTTNITHDATGTSVDGVTFNAGAVTGVTSINGTKIGTQEGGTYIHQDNSIWGNMKNVDTQVKTNADAIGDNTTAITALESKVGTVGTGEYLDPTKSVGENLGRLDAGLKKEVDDRTAADDALSGRITDNAKEIARVNQELVNTNNHFNTELGNTNAALQAEGQARANADAALANDITATNKRTAGIGRTDTGVEADNQTVIEGKVHFDQNGNVSGVKDLKTDTIHATGEINTTGKVSAGDVSTGTLETTGNAKIGGDLTVDGKLNVGEIYLDHKKLEPTGKEYDSATSISADGISNRAKVTDELGNSTESKFTHNEKGTFNYATDKDGNKTYTKVTATENSFQVQDKDGKNKNHQVNTKDSSVTEITNADGKKTTTKQTATDITNTAKDGTITNEANHIENTATTMKTTVTGQATQNFNGGLNTTVTGTEKHTVNGKQINTVTEGQENIISGGQTNTITGGQINNITGDQTTTITGNKKETVTENVTEDYKKDLTTTVGGNENHEVKGTKTETVERKLTENFKGGQETNVTGDQTTNVSGTQTINATDINRNASSGMIDTVDNAYGTNKETKVAGSTTTEVSIKGTNESGTYIRGATEARDYIIKGTLSNSETKTAEATSTEITDGTNKASTIQKVTDLAGSVTNGTETGVSGIHAKDNSVSIDSIVTDGNKSYSVINQKKGSIQSTVVDGTSSTVILQDKDNVTIASSKGMVGIVGKDIVNNAQDTITNTAGTKITDTAGDSTVTTENGKGTRFTKTGSTAYREGGPTDTNISGNTITTGKVTMDYADVMKDLGVRGNANITGKTTTGSLEVKGESKLTGDVTMENNATVGKNLTVNGITTTNTLKVTENAEIDGNATIKGDVTARSYKVGDKTYIDANGIHANGQKITDVADGSISEGSKDAVNGGQLYGVKRDLEHQVDKVGANAAAMANLRPMEFDPSSKWNIAAAIGNYGSETAAALGAFYRPNDDVMVNLSTAFGTGENMVGGGVSVRLGKSGNKLSREETNALKAQVDDLTARMDALLSVLNPNMSKDFPDVPENHWAYEAVSRLAGNDIVQGYPDGEFHGERTMTRYEMAEIIYNALSRGAEAEKELVEEFKPELQAMAASEKATAEKAEG